MPDSPLASDLSHLQELALACYWLVGVSGVIWFVCYLVRLRRLAVHARNLAAEERLTDQVLELSVSPDPDPDTFDRLKPWERRILLRVFLALIEQTKGRDQTALINLMRRAGFLRRGLKALSEGRPAERQIACGILACFDHPSAIGALRAALRDRDQGVRITAARALLEADLVVSLRQLLASMRFPADDPPIVLADLFDRLPASLSEEAVIILGEPLPLEWKRMLAIALGRKQVGAAYPELVALRQAPESRLRAAAWVALRELGDPQAGDLAAGALADASPDVRTTAAQCLGALGSPEMLPRLLPLLADPDWWVRYHAASALYDSGADGRRLLEQHCVGAAEDDTGLQVWRERAQETDHAA